jgi:hypothetical protein
MQVYSNNSPLYISFRHDTLGLTGTTFFFIYTGIIILRDLNYSISLSIPFHRKWQFQSWGWLLPPQGSSGGRPEPLYTLCWASLLHSPWRRSDSDLLRAHKSASSKMSCNCLQRYMQLNSKSATSILQIHSVNCIEYEARYHLYRPQRHLT